MVCTTWAGCRAWVPSQYEKNEPVFHAPWEGRVYALNRAMRAWRKWNLDTDRHGSNCCRLPTIAHELLRAMG